MNKIMFTWLIIYARQNIFHKEKNIVVYGVNSPAKMST